MDWFRGDGFRRGMVVLVGCYILFTSSFLAVMSVIANDLKEYFSITQSQMEVMVSMANFGLGIGFFSGIILEKGGPQIASIVALVIFLIGYAGIYIAAFQPQKFSNAWGTVYLGTFSFISGLGAMHMYMNGVAVNAYNFSIENRGKVIGFVACFYFLGLAFYSMIYREFFGPTRDIRGFLMFVMIMSAITNLISILTLRKVQLEEAEEQMKPSENSSLVESSTKSLKIQYYGELKGLDVLKRQEFQLIMCIFILATSTSFLYCFNIVVILKTMKLTHLESLLVTLGPLCGGFSKLGVGILSDVTLTRYPRVTYVIILNALQLLTFTLFCFIPQYPAVTILTTIVQFTSLGAFMTILPTMIADNFGTTYFAQMWGGLNIGYAIFSLIINTIFGAIYDLNSTRTTKGPTEKECYGAKCFRAVFIMVTVISCLTLLMSSALYIIQSKEHTNQSGKKEVSKTPDTEPEKIKDN